MVAFQQNRGHFQKNIGRSFNNYKMLCWEKKGVKMFSNLSVYSMNNCRSHILILICAALSVQANAQSLQSTAVLTEAQSGVIDEYCVTCHNLDDYSGSLDLSVLLNDALPAHAETWEKVIRKLRAGRK